MTTSCPCCGGSDFDCVERDYDLNEYLYECNDCHCLFIIREEIEIVEEGKLYDDKEEED